MNIANSSFCKVCGKEIASPYAVDVLLPGVYQQVPDIFQQPLQTSPAENDSFMEPDAETFSQRDDDYGKNTMNATFVPVASKHESLLERLDRMERELDDKRREPLPETPLSLPDDMDKHEAALKDIAYTLDSLITDLLEAEAGEYSFPGLVRSDETSSETQDEVISASKGIEKREHGSDKNNSRKLQEILMLATLIAAIFMVGLSFGLWGSFFLGL
jgi:hypothetical protein